MLAVTGYMYNMLAMVGYMYESSFRLYVFELSDRLLCLKYQATVSNGRLHIC